MKKNLRNEEGSGLILALMTLMVLSVLGASLGAITIGSHRLSSVNRDSTSAYYIAEAGANQAFEEIESIVNNAYNKTNNQSIFFDEIDYSIKSTFDANYEIDFANQAGKSPSVSLNILKRNDLTKKKYTIQSVGEISGQTRIVEKSFSIDWLEKDKGINFNLPDKIGLIANEKIYINGTQVSGGVFANSTNNDSIELTHTNVNQAVFYYTSGYEPKDVMKYPNWNKPVTQVITENIKWENFYELLSEFPDFPYYNHIEDNKNISVSNGQGPKTITLEKNVMFNEIFLDNNENLYIDTNNKDISISTKHLNLRNGHIHILGNGKITFHVSNKITMSSSSTINKSGDNSRLSIFYSGDNDIKTQGNENINGSLFSNSTSANIHFGGSTTISGGLVSAGKEIKLSGSLTGSPYIIAPLGTILMENGDFKGVLLGETIRISGGSVFTYEKYNMDNFPFRTSGSNGSANGDNSLVDLITSQPIIEPK